MFTFIMGVFIILHGLVHLLYFGQSQRFFELQSGMLWPDNSWAFSRLLGVEATRLLASIFCLLAAISLALGGIGILADQTWWQPIVVGGTATSSVLFLFFWDGGLRKLDDNGGIGLLIDLTILVGALIS
ncbi:MAG: hypothetical protein HY866_03325 [Chloroflexi bacterium]|nr:hypothetical protein [Chloroflexota bacterium]